MISLTNSWDADDRRCLHIGLVNNMPDAALEATERQFRTLLSEAAQDVTVHLSFFAIPEVARSGRAKYRVDNDYASIGALWNNQLDGLIVTGAEPIAGNLKREPFWSGLTQLIAWAEEHAHSAIWSCLAAQAAVLSLDGIGRQPIGGKLFGIFECETARENALTRSVPAEFWVPHSRWNDIPRASLEACGYRVLTQFKNGMVDAFVKQRKSLFVFFQGHPEYDPASLLLEYRRDIRRFLLGERDTYPAMPEGCFDDDATVALNCLQERALAQRCEQSFEHFPASVQAASVRRSWRLEATAFYRNWLEYLVEQKSKRLASRARRIGYPQATASTAVAATPATPPEIEAG